jgi:hypothetical protein
VDVVSRLESRQREIAHGCEQIIAGERVGRIRPELDTPREAADAEVSQGDLRAIL